VRKWRFTVDPVNVLVEFFESRVQISSYKYCRSGLWLVLVSRTTGRAGRDVQVGTLNKLIRVTKRKILARSTLLIVSSTVKNPLSSSQTDTYIDPMPNITTKPIRCLLGTIKRYCCAHHNFLFSLRFNVQRMGIGSRNIVRSKKMFKTVVVI